jgi:hypothetical protein
MKKNTVIIFICILAFQATSTAQLEPIKLLGRHTITFEGGAKTNSNISVITNTSGVETKTGFVGSFNYGYWFDEEWAISLSAGVFGAGASTKYNIIGINSILPFLFGVKYYPAKLAMGSVGRFYAGLAVGDYVGVATKTSNLMNQTVVTESSFGGQVSVGVDLFIASWFKLGPKLSYHFLGNYSENIGATKNLSGAAFSLEAGFVL